MHHKEAFLNVPQKSSKNYSMMVGLIIVENATFGRSDDVQPLHCPLRQLLNTAP